MNVVIYGANGWTGSLIAATLDQHGHRLVLAGRNRDKLDALRARLGNRPEVRLGDIRDRSDLEHIFDGADVVIPCAGPYRGLGNAAFEAALSRGCHYFDVCGEYAYVDESYDRYRDDARRRGLTFCPGFAVKGVLGDWCASMAAADRSSIDEVVVGYAHALREYLFASPGSMVSAASQGLFYSRDRFDAAFPVARRIEYPPPLGIGTALLVPMADEASIPRNLPTSITRTYVAVAPGTPVNDLWASFFGSNLHAMPMLATLVESNPGIFKALNETRRLVPNSVTFGAMAEVTSRGRSDRVGITLDDGYQATADLIAHAIRLLPSAPRGTITPTQLCDPRAALRELCRAHGWKSYRWSDA